MNDVGMTTPELRFPNFHDRWKEWKISELFVIGAGGDINKENFSTTKSEYHVYPVYANALKRDGLFGFSSEYKVLPPALTVTGRGDIGFAKARYEPFYPIVRLLSLIPKEQLDIKFCEEIINRIDFKQESTGVPQLTVPQLGKYSFFLPSIQEQNKIGDFFSLVDQSIKNLDEKIKLLELQKKGIMRKIFRQENRFSGFSDSWMKYRICEIGQVVGGGTPSSENDEYWNGDISWFTPTEIGKEKYVSESRKKISQLGLARSSARLLAKGSILLSSRATIGLISILENEACTNQGFQSLVTNSNVNNEFIYYYLSQLQETLLELANGSTFKEVSKNSIENIELFIPTKTEQEKIVEVLSKLDARISINKSSLQNVKQLRRGLLGKMLV